MTRVRRPPHETSDEDDPMTEMRLSLAQVAAVRRELQAALDALDALDHLCEVQQHVRRIEEGIGAALYILDAGKPASPTDDGRPATAGDARADV